MSETPEWHSRLDVNKYRETSEQQQLAYLLGVIDTICYSYIFLSPVNQARAIAIDDYTKEFSAGDLRKLFADYLDANNGLETYNAAAVFLIALGKLSGFDE